MKNFEKILELTKQVDIKTMGELYYFNKYNRKLTESLEEALTRFYNETLTENLKQMSMYETRKIFNRTYQKIYGFYGQTRLIEL